MRTPTHARRKERGQTILLVAVAMVVLLGLAALAIDVVTLYVASGEIQRAADSAAIAGAKVFVDTGVTTDPTNTTLQTLAQNTANSIITTTVSQNTVSGVAPTLNGTPVYNFNAQGNPQVTVNLQRTNLPTFFARIWGYQLATVSASAIAEAYNPAYAQSGGATSTVAIQPKCVKPWLIPNAYVPPGPPPPPPPPPAVPFIDPTTGAVTAPASQFANKAISFSTACGGPSCNVTPNPGQFVPALTTVATNNLCPTCQGATQYEQGIECCDVNTVYTCGGGTANVAVDTTAQKGQVDSETRSGVQCLSHAANLGLNQGQDQWVPPTTNASSYVTAGSGNPLIGGSSKIKSGDNISTSNSIVTIPIFNGAVVGGEVNVVGFLQVFVTDVNNVQDDGNPCPGGANTCVNGLIMNVLGCGATLSTPAITQGSSVAVPVRLIHQ